MDPRNTETNILFETVMDAVKLYLHQTGYFPVTSNRGLKYVFILYSYDANTILSYTLKGRTVKEIIHTYTTCHEHLKEKVSKPKIHWLYNEESNTLKK